MLSWLEGPKTVGLQDIIVELMGDTRFITPLNPFQLCARGATLIVSGKALITEVLSRSLGIEVVGGKLSIIMHRMRELPLEACETYFPPDLDAPLMIHLYEGEEEIAKENLLLGSFEVIGFKSLDDAFQVHIEVNSNNKVSVRANRLGETKSQLRV